MRGPVLLLGQWFFPPSDLSGLVPPDVLQRWWLGAVVFLALLAGYSLRFCDATPWLASGALACCSRSFRAVRRFPPIECCCFPASEAPRFSVTSLTRWAAGVLRRWPDPANRGTGGARRAHRHALCAVAHLVASSHQRQRQRPEAPDKWHRDAGTRSDLVIEAGRARGRCDVQRSVSASGTRRNWTTPRWPIAGIGAG
jgi:hypothetical protein